MTSSDDQALHQLLLDLRAQLNLLIDDPAGATAAVELDQAMVGRLSRIDAIQHQEMAKAQQRRAKERLVQVEARLQQFASEDESFGACNDCLEPIPWARLEAIPDAEFCVPCLQQRNEL